MPEIIPHARLAPSDVLLFRGTGRLARAIQRFDGTEFNHAGLFVGDRGVAEALAPGVILQTLAKSTEGRQRVLARRLASRPPTSQPVLDVADRVLAEGHRYAYEQLLLLAFLALTRKLPLSPWLKPLVRAVLDAAAGLVEGLISRGKEPMICSEFVYRCHDEALSEARDIYSLEINPFPAPTGPAIRSAETTRRAGRGLHDESLLAWRLSAAGRAAAASGLRAAGVREAATEADVASLIDRYLADLDGSGDGTGAPAVDDAGLAASIDGFALAVRATTRPPESLRAEVAVRGLLDTVPHFVTPGDLLHTASLYSVGDLELP